MNYIISEIAEKILNAKSNEIFINLDLNRTDKKEKVIVDFERRIAKFPEGEVEFNILQKISKDKNHIYFIKDGNVFKAAIARDGYYKLVPTLPPTIEINGIRMHRTKEFNPYEDTLNKINSVNIKKGEKVLDTCMGLGYTAIEARKRGAEVITIEKNPNVLELAKINPYSRELFEKGIKIILGDAFDVIKNFNDEEFDVVVHDPPRFSLAGHLYSEEFYKEIFRVLKPGGRLFHYVGNPGRKYRGKDLQRGVMERLRSVGFENVKKVEDALGVVAKKPEKY
ncbi:Methyltransferase type 11 [Methanocaldococcus vulcanius M7]|uniref:Methyltransferase type 11 n=1 Tax=Methanocaldococcus vulcanius (strain ATCC 700851 / DSM 12094 / M7) TaxID=579137 RepID=C9RGQ9_METVM|nr:methyltransferase domain-containing protein [Methanocaldococcus vulcanius]ACX72761.1 Methyltransferase type 11 [Methanocaldococcus vulcanius M7]